MAASTKMLDSLSKLLVLQAADRALCTRVSTPIDSFISVFQFLHNHVVAGIVIAPASANTFRPPTGTLDQAP